LRNRLRARRPARERSLAALAIPRVEEFPDGLVARVRLGLTLSDPALSQCTPKDTKHEVAGTRAIAKAAKLLDIRLHDCIIIGDGTGEHYSFDEAGRIERQHPTRSRRE
jgi:hypothetical protein